MINFDTKFLISTCDFYTKNKFVTKWKNICTIHYFSDMETQHTAECPQNIFTTSFFSLHFSVTAEQYVHYLPIPVSLRASLVAVLDYQSFYTLPLPSTCFPSPLTLHATLFNLYNAHKCCHVTIAARRLQQPLLVSGQNVINLFQISRFMKTGN